MFTVNQFLPGGAVATLDNGKKIYIQQIGTNRLQFIARRPVKWTLTDNKGNILKSMFAIPGTIQGIIDNSFFSNNDNNVKIQFLQGSAVWTAVLNADNFDLTPLQYLPDVDRVKTAAQIKTDEANEADRLSKTPFLNQLFNSIVGIDGKTFLMYGSLVIGLLLFLKLKK